MVDRNAAQALLEVVRRAILRISEPLLGGLEVQLERGLVVDRDAAQALLKVARRAILRLCVPLLGGLEEPGHRLLLVLCNASTLLEKDHRVRLGGRVVWAAACPCRAALRYHSKAALSSCATPPRP